MPNMRELLLGLRRRSSGDATASSSDLAELQARCMDLEERLHWCDQQLRERSDKLYALQQQYSTEHFTLYESMRDLKTERLRNAGAYASLDNILARAKQLQGRIEHLKSRLRQYEHVDDLYFDTEPIFIEDPKK